MIILLLMYEWCSCKTLVLSVAYSWKPPVEMAWKKFITDFDQNILRIFF